MGLEEIATFVEAVEHGSLVGAARALGVPKSTVSRRLARLEAQLGQELVQRHARLFRVTEAGDVLYRRSVGAVRDLREAEREAREGGGGVRGELRLTAPQDLGVSSPIVALVAGFRRAHPDVSLSVDVTDRTVDVAAEGYDFALRAHIGRLPDSSSIGAKAFGTLRIGLFASPAYLDRRGRPQEPQDLDGHDGVAPIIAGGAPRIPLDGPQGSRHEWNVPPGLSANTMGFLPAAAAMGAGIAPIALMVARPLVAEGRLERVLPLWSMRGATLSLLWPLRRLPSPRRRALLDYFTEHLHLD